MSCAQNQLAIEQLIDDIAALEAQFAALALPVPCTSLPAVVQDCISLRLGVVGSATQYLRCDSRTPLRRLAYPTDPVLAATGTATINSQAVRRRWSGSDWVKFGIAFNVTHAAGAGWGILTVPVIAGFQQPEIEGKNSYRYVGLVNDDDTPSTGAQPDRFYMGVEFSHYLFTRRLYLGQFRNREEAATYWDSVNVKYTCN